MSLGVSCATSEQKTQCQGMDKIMKRLGIELASDGQDAIPMVHCNVDVKPLAYKHVKDQVAIVMKIRCILLETNY